MPKKLDKKDQKIAELTSDLLRAHADLVNYQRRSEDEKSKLADFARAMVVRQLLPLIDNLELALSHLPKDLQKNDWAKGVANVGRQVQETLSEMGVDRIKTVGSTFDPHLHEAVSVDGEGHQEIISEELRSGYKLGDEVIRPAMVRIKKEQPK